MTEKEAKILFPTLVGKTVLIDTAGTGDWYLTKEVESFTDRYLIGKTIITHSGSICSSTMTNIRSIRKLKIKE